MLPAAALLACLCLAVAARTVPDSCQGTILPYFSDAYETNIGLFFVYLLLMGYFFIGVSCLYIVLVASVRAVVLPFRELNSSLDWFDIPRWLL